MPPDVTASPRRLALAWALMVGGLAGFWYCRPWLPPAAYNYGQLFVLLGTWKVASLLALPPAEWSRFTPLRFLAYCLFPGMQPRQFLAGREPVRGAPVPTVSGILFNIAGGATLLLLVPRVLPAWTPLAVRFWIGLVGLG